MKALNILNLNEFEVLKVETNDHYYKITVEKKDKPDFCTHCMWDTMQSQIFEEHKGKEFKLHSSKERIVSDISMYGKTVKKNMKERSIIIKNQVNLINNPQLTSP